jgi:hypothetical protein
VFELKLLQAPHPERLDGIWRPVTVRAGRDRSGPTRTPGVHWRKVV